MSPLKTDDLNQALHQSTQVEQYLQEQKKHLLDSSLDQLLEQLLKAKQLSKSQVIHKAELNEIYGYQIFAGKRRPSRDKLLCLGLSMALTEQEIQNLLKAAQMAPLYPRNRRDSIVLFGFIHKQSVMEVNSTLFEMGENTL